LQVLTNTTIEGWTNILPENPNPDTIIQ